MGTQQLRGTRVRGTIRQLRFHPRSMGCRSASRPELASSTDSSQRPNHEGDHHDEHALPVLVAGIRGLHRCGDDLRGDPQFFTDEVSAGISAGKIVALVLWVAAGCLILLGLAVLRTSYAEDPRWS